MLEEPMENSKLTLAKPLANSSLDAGRFDLYSLFQKETGLFTESVQGSQAFPSIHPSILYNHLSFRLDPTGASPSTLLHTHIHTYRLIKVAR